ncbi:tRNA lysidine(34) synthetase TilS [Lichenibacterium dinghuense]|uniref:tRNA lysidine(34) synthetase TilS n=1 Tax=Lichenibacterium dinghuense TaxID=2895977 RepID=UPI002815FE43|nr:tRNA lysidine(34) synthetase TilS [Lichenibacterium sp. 6Y81]
MADPALPLGSDEVRLLFSPFAQARAVLLAVSGGPDSTALMHFAAAAARADPALPPLAVATVDHGLRPDSRAEAEAVARDARTLGLPHRLLSWEGPKPATRLQERARDARYGLLVGCARDTGATHIVTAHTLDDQAETVLFRLMRGSGPAGLAGMAACGARHGVVHLRPFLGVPKSRLVAACRANGWPFVADPANADPRFARARLRALMPALAAEGLDAPRLATLARRMGEAEAALASAAGRAIAEARVGPGLYSAPRLLGEPTAVRVRAFGRLIDDGSPSRLERLERLVEAVSAAADRGVPLRRTLAGVLVAFDGAARLSLAPAPPRRTPANLGS